MEVEPPDVIDPVEGAKIINNGPTVLVVTISSDDGPPQTVEVPPFGVEFWYPPEGWRSARFTAPGQKDQTRMIET